MSGRGHGDHRPWSQAREAAGLLGGRRSPAPRDLPLTEALGAVLAADVRALAGLPAFDASAMDGFAVAGRGPWRLVGRQLAGASPESVVLRPGEAVEIATGARVPKDTDSVLPYELAVAGGGTVDGPAEAGRHVRWAGEETAPGETVLTRGTVVGPAALGLVASLGHETLPVLSPRVSVLVTGDEVTTSGLPGDGSVRDAIGPMLPGIVDRAGGRVGEVRHLGDDRRPMLGAVADAGGDVVVVCGSSSRGPADHLRSVLAELDAHVVVDGVACRPGHPQLLAHTDRTVFVGLPGNPGAALVAAVTLLVPLLAAMTGRADPCEGLSPAVLEGRVSAHPRDTRLVPVRLDGDRARPVGHDRPGSLRGAAQADAYAVVPPDWGGAEADLLRLP
ncbi:MULTISPECIES: molybdopterin molybdotransferase MoeA [Nocardiopsis]|uniref:Molybdopterin molybdenumtransferase n=1 Tax=Nocardiopsis sinuspersici TaxID=501010 RepID=A0A1V3C269_9ACTN|nr:MULTISPECIES: molybdopterin molybdotransferase MoeA [Nocardiopsis]NYH51130.1 molybdopterin molybdotransferase [Nocardiopsis sinuspersici]OOC54901.1 molybdopterin molybdenumtransferase MoeA [Nocardiopsis sinuspersici]